MHAANQRPYKHRVQTCPATVYLYSKGYLLIIFSLFDQKKRLKIDLKFNTGFNHTMKRLSIHWKCNLLIVLKL